MAYFMCDEMMHIMYNIAFRATGVVPNIFTFLKANCLKYQVMAKLLNPFTPAPATLVTGMLAITRQPP